MRASRTALARACTLVLAGGLACARLGRPAGDDDDRKVEFADEPMTDEQQQRLLARASEGGLLYWRLPGASGPRCEAWRLVPNPEGPDRGRLVLHAPEREPVPQASPETTTQPAPSASPKREPAPVPADSSRPAPSSVPADSSRSAPSRVLAHAAPPVPSAPAGPEPLPVPEDTSEPIASPAPSDMSHQPGSLRMAYRLADGHLSLTAPEHERPMAAPVGATLDLGLALTCVFTGISVTGAGGARRLILAARERFFFTAEACAAADAFDDEPGPDELRTLGCAAALADSGTRARLDAPPPATAPDLSARLHRARAVHLLRRGPDGAARCDAWRNHPEKERGHGQLVRRDRDEHGAFVRTYAYDVGPGYITVQGPAEVRRITLAGKPADVVRASGCLVTRFVTAVTDSAAVVGPDPWYLSKRSCEQARRAANGEPVDPSPLLVPACE